MKLILSQETSSELENRESACFSYFFIFPGPDFGAILQRKAEEEPSLVITVLSCFENSRLDMFLISELLWDGQVDKF